MANDCGRGIFAGFSRDERREPRPCHTAWDGISGRGRLTCPGCLPVATRWVGGGGGLLRADPSPGGRARVLQRPLARSPPQRCFGDGCCPPDDDAHNLCVLIACIHEIGLDVPTFADGALAVG
jgi:hypothetical protein